MRAEDERQPFSRMDAELGRPLLIILRLEMSGVSSQVKKTTAETLGQRFVSTTKAVRIYILSIA